jgi:serine/threonine protein kinase
MRKLVHHHIVDYIGIGCTDKSSSATIRSTMYLVSELLEGGTLKRLVMQQLTDPHK